MKVSKLFKISLYVRHEWNVLDLYRGNAYYNKVNMRKKAQPKK